MKFSVNSLGSFFTWFHPKPCRLLLIEGKTRAEHLPGRTCRGEEGHVPGRALSGPQSHSGGCFPAACVAHLKQSLFLGTCCLQLLGMAHHVRGALGWALGLAHLF